MKRKIVTFNNHIEYITLLKRLKPDTKYIQLVQIDNDASDSVIVKALEVMELVGKKKTNNWLGTKTKGAGALQYTFIASNVFWGISQYF